MKIISTNIGEPQIISWRGKEVSTGIYKYPVNKSIYLGKEDVDGDHVMDRRYHGGTDKACYLYSKDHYEYWKKLYPELDWQWGMFGENLTIEGLNEAKIKIGDTFKLGSAIVQASQPRQPCFKLGIRFGTQKVINQFIDFGNAGVYVRVLKSGDVKSGDSLERIESNSESFSIREIFQMIYAKEIDIEIIRKAISDPALAESCHNDLKKIWGN